MSADWYTPEQEVWSAEYCRKLSRLRETDGYGSKHPWPGQVQSSSTAYPRYGYHRYNGGFIAPDGKYYRMGMRVPWPKPAKGYVLIRRPTWGVYLIPRKDLEPDMEVIDA